MSDNKILDVVQSISDAVRTVEGIRCYDRMGVDVAPPAVVIGPPGLTWEHLCRPPTGADAVVYVVVEAGERALEQLYHFTPLVAAAIDEHVVGAAVKRAHPGLFPTGATDLPAYEITVSIDL
jgi:hypothetical protein